MMSNFNGLTEVFQRAQNRADPDAPHTYVTRTQAMRLPKEQRAAIIREQLSSYAVKFAAMNDSELMLERAALDTDVDSCKLDLKAYQEGITTRDQNWQISAEKALVYLKAQASIAEQEISKRKALAREHAASEYKRRSEEQAEQRRLAAEQHVAFIEAGRKVRRAKLFVTKSREILPADTVAAIWNAVDQSDHQT